jgi:hypothetical protein
MFAMPITTVPDKVYKLPDYIGQLMWIGYV